MKRNVLVVDPSIMIHKIVQLAFPEEQYDVIISNNYPLENEPEDTVHLALISADLPGHDDVLETVLSIKKSYDCPVLLMIPKFHEHDIQYASKSGIDATIEKPFTSDALKERVAGLTEVPGDLNEMESLSQEELESITDDEFMLSEEDLMDIGEEDLADVEIPEDLPSGVEPDTAELAETESEPSIEPPAPESPVAEGEPEELKLEPEPNDEPALTDAEEEQAFRDLEEEDHVLDEPEAESESSGDMPFDDMEIEDDLDSIDFGDLDTDDQLLAEDALKDLPQAQEPPADDTDEAGPAFGFQEDAQSEPPAPEAEETHAEPEASEPEPVEPDKEVVEAEDPTPEPEDLPDAFQLGTESEPESAPETEEPIVEAEAEEDVEVDFAIEDEPRTVQLDEYEVEAPEEEAEVPTSVEDEDQEEEEEEEKEPEPVPEPLDLSRAEEDHEVIHPPSSLSDSAAGKSLLSDEDIDRIAKRVVEVLGQDALKEVAWEVIPIVAEEVVRSRIRELEQDQD